MHGGDYDVRLLSRDHGFSFRRVFDTMIAATLLGDEKVGLQALVEGAYGVHLSKKYQTANWGRRPFTPAHVDYLRGDTAHLLGLRDLLGARLEERDLARGGRDRVPAARGTARRGVRRRPRRVAQGEGRREARRARARRDGEDVGVARAAGAGPQRAAVPHRAQRRRSSRWPPRRRPTSRAFARRPGPRPSWRRATATPCSRRSSPASPPPSGARHRRPRSACAARPRSARALDAARTREERVRRWRTDEAKRRGVPNVVVLPNPALDAFCEDPPTDVEAIARHPDVGAEARGPLRRQAARAPPRAGALGPARARGPSDRRRSRPYLDRRALTRR